MLVAAAALFQPALRQTEARQTNIDRIAATLENAAGKDDLILINPWYLAVTFNRYYHGRTPWVTVPPMDDHSIHRYDLLKQRMQEERPIQPLFGRIGTALGSGHLLWIVGWLQFVPPGATPTVMPPAPGGPEGWSNRPYEFAWGEQVGYYLQTHVPFPPEIVPVDPPGPINSHETETLIKFHGWRG